MISSNDIAAPIAAEAKNSYVVHTAATECIVFWLIIVGAVAAHANEERKSHRVVEGISVTDCRILVLLYALLLVHQMYKESMYYI